MQMILTTIAVVVDKARAQQSAISQLSSEYPNVAQFRCGAHTHVASSYRKCLHHNKLDYRKVGCFEKVYELLSKTQVRTEEGFELQRTASLLKQVI